MALALQAAAAATTNTRTNGYVDCDKWSQLDKIDNDELRDRRW